MIKFLLGLPKEAIGLVILVVAVLGAHLWVARQIWK